MNKLTKTSWLDTHLNTKNITQLTCHICHTFLQQNFPLKFLLNNLKSRESKRIFLTLLTITHNMLYDFFRESNRDNSLARSIENTIASCLKRIGVLLLKFSEDEICQIKCFILKNRIIRYISPLNLLS